MKGGVITTTSGVSARTGEAFVSLHWRDQVAQFDVAEALAFGMNLLIAAEAANMDAALLKGLGIKSDAKEAGVLALIREHRQGGASGWSFKAINEANEE